MTGKQLIFLDMDGVLCDFVSRAFEVHDAVFHKDRWPKGTYAIQPILGVTTGEFWRRIDDAGVRFWALLEPYPWAADLVTELSRIGEVVISTSPSQSPSCYSGKREWLQNHGMGNLPSMFGSRKHLMSQHGRILIDDNSHNTWLWETRGGQSILFPQPWNPAEEVDDIVEHIISQVRDTMGVNA